MYICIGYLNIVCLNETSNCNYTGVKFDPSSQSPREGGCCQCAAPRFIRVYWAHEYQCSREGGYCQCAATRFIGVYWAHEYQCSREGVGYSQCAAPRFIRVYWPMNINIHERCGVLPVRRP